MHREANAMPAIRFRQPRRTADDGAIANEFAVAVEQQPACELLRQGYGGRGLPPAARDAKRLTMQGRCAWTNKQSDQVKEVTLLAPNRLGLQPKPRTFQVLPDCEEQLRRFIRRLERFGLLFSLSVLSISIAMVFAAALGQYGLIPWLVAVIGILLIVFPFATPETVSLMGFRTSIIVVRFFGLVLLVLAAYLMAMRLL